MGDGKAVALKSEGLDSNPSPDTYQRYLLGQVSWGPCSLICDSGVTQVSCEVVVSVKEGNVCVAPDTSWVFSEPQVSSPTPPPTWCSAH